MNGSWGSACQILICSTHCREMLRIKRSVAASFSQVHYNTTLVEATTAPAALGRLLLSSQHNAQSWCPGFALHICVSSSVLLQHSRLTLYSCCLIGHRQLSSQGRSCKARESHAQCRCAEGHLGKRKHEEGAAVICPDYCWWPCIRCILAGAPGSLYMQGGCR